MFVKLSIVIAFICSYCIPNAIAADSKSNQCYTCRGINCLRTTTQEVYETCVYNSDICVTIFDKFAVTAKGCFLNIPVELRNKCNDRSNPECQKCVGGLCNNLGRKDFKCYECNEKDDRNCATNVNSLTPVQCKIPSAPNSYCFTDRTKEGHLRRGCSLHVKDQNECLANDKCTLCSVEDGQQCNAMSIETPSGGGKKSTVDAALVMLCVSFALSIFKL